MNGIEKKIDYVGFFAIGFFSWAYSLFARTFAKLHIALPFLNFPVFMGEILLLFCSILLIMRWILTRQKINCWHCLLFLYLGFVIAKALWGYSQWGPLAFRHAALFYYPLFAVFGYYFYRKSFFNNRINILLVILIILTFKFFRFYEYFLITHFFLGVILLNSCTNKCAKYGFLLALVISAPYSILFYTSRTFFLSNTASIVFVIASGFILLPIKRSYRVIISISVVVLLYMIAWGMSDQRSIKSMIDFKAFRDKYRSFRNEICQKEANFKMEELKEVKLYNKPVSPFGSSFEGKISKKPISQPSQPKEEGSTANKISEVSSKVKELSFEIDELSSKVRAIKILAQESDKSDVVDGQRDENVELASQVGYLSSTIDELSSKVEGVKNSAQKSDESNVGDSQVDESIESVPESKLMPSTVEELSSRVGETETLEPQPDKSNFENSQIDEISKIESELENLSSKIVQISSNASKVLNSYKSYEVGMSNSFFRLFMWKDMIKDLRQKKPLLGFDFGMPFRSRNIEIVGWAGGEWSRDGWIATHNSYLEAIYRSGIVGILLIGLFFITLFRMIKNFLDRKSLSGIFLSAILINWLVAANFLVILEMPYNAIAFWSMFGIALALYKPKDNKCAV